MCVGAMFHARIARTVYGAKDPKKLVLKNQVMIEGGALAEECGAILSASSPRGDEDPDRRGEKQELHAPRRRK